VPTYSYRCTECGVAFDIQQAFTDDTLSECPTCGGALRKIFSPVGVSFSGSGFYRNDSRPAPKESAGGSSTPSTPVPAAASAGASGGSGGSSSTGSSAPKTSTT
jgi:putative FmdB family regulatory protein